MPLQLPQSCREALLPCRRLILTDFLTTLVAAGPGLLPQALLAGRWVRSACLLRTLQTLGRQSPASRRLSSQGLQCPEETGAPDPSASKQSLGQEPRTCGYQGSQEVSQYQPPTREEGFSAGLRQLQRQRPSPGSSGFHHPDERHRLGAGGLRYPDTAQVLCLGTGLCAEVSVADLLLY